MRNPAGGTPGTPLRGMPSIGIRRTRPEARFRTPEAPGRRCIRVSLIPCAGLPGRAAWAAVIPLLIAMGCGAPGKAPGAAVPSKPSEWEALARRVPGSFAPHLYVAYEALNRSDWKAFEEAAARARGTAGEDARKLGAVGTLYLLAGRRSPERRARDLATAEQVLETALRKDPRDRTAAYHLGLARYLLRKFEKATETLETLVRGDGSDLDALRLLGRCYIELGDPAAALARIQRCLALAPSDPRNLELAGICTYLLGRHGEAENYFRRAIEIRPDDSRLWWNLGLTYRERGMEQKAAECFRRAGASK